jgi:hypothetical protein
MVKRGKNAGIAFHRKVTICKNSILFSLFRKKDIGPASTYTTWGGGAGASLSPDIARIISCMDGNGRRQNGTAYERGCGAFCRAVSF